MNMKSNQRREVDQLNRRRDSRDLLLRKLGESVEKKDGSNMSLNSLLFCHHSESKASTNIMCPSRNNHNHSAIAYDNNSIHIDRKLPTPLHHKTQDQKANDINLEYTLTQKTMYNSATMQPVAKSNKRHPNVLLRLARRRRETTNASRRILSESISRFYRPSLTLVVIVLALYPCIFMTNTQALSTGAEGSDASPSQSSSLASSNQLPASSQSASLSPAQSLASSMASSALSSISSAIISAALQDGKSNGGGGSGSDRLDSLDTSGGSESALSAAPSISSASSSSSSSSPSAATTASLSSSAPQSGSNSLAASLSSAVASAAAAAAVAAAQNSLSGGDARSLLTGSSSSNHHSNHHHHHQHRNSGLNLALKIADAIPEVPYNILHNMKKLDHAAPFYNVGNKVSYSGNSKESTHGFLSSALHAAGGLEQLSALFKSPIWKRIADGYGEFTSEFRSLFRAPPTTMKGPTSSTTKLLRDISVPALLMILASTIPGDWRPVRTRRKSLLPGDLASAYPLVDPMTASASAGLPNYSAAPQLFGTTSNINMGTQQQQQIIPQLYQTGKALSPLAQMYNRLEQSLDGIQARSNDINLQQQDTVSTVAWMQPPTVSAQSEPTGQMHNYETQMHQIQLHQHPSQQLQPVRRFGDSPPTATAHSQAGGDSSHSDVKPVNSGRLDSNNLSVSSSSSAEAANTAAMAAPKSVAGSLFSSLTSGLVNQVGHSKLMNRIMNANTASRGSDNLQQANSNRMPNGLMYNGRELPSLHRDHLNDKHRYSLVDDDSIASAHDNDMHHSRNGATSEQQQVLQPAKPFLLSSLTQALGSVLANPPHKSGSTASLNGGGDSHGVISRKMFTLNGGGLQNSLIGDKTINHQDALLRRNHQASGGVMEQRELSKLIPQSWREVVKRTVNSVQEQATTQWRSIEGQLTNWVQDKLKTFPAAAPSSSVASSSGSSAAPVSNIFASVSSTALNMLGLGGKTALGGSNASVPASSSGEQAAANPATDDSSATPVLKNKADSSTAKPKPLAKGALAGVANMIVNTLANRQITATSQTIPKNKNPSSSDESTSSGTNVGQYPTLTGIQSPSSSSSSSILVDVGSSSSSSSSLLPSSTSSTAPGMSLVAA